MTVREKGGEYDSRKKESYINFAMLLLRRDIYLEIGVRDGECVRQINSRRKIAIDPNRNKFGKERKGEIFFVMESDTFFENHLSEVLAKRSVDVALVDGPQEFRQVMKDLANLEPYMNQRGIVFIHDCNPAIREHSEKRDGGVWNCDVWKAAYYLVKNCSNLSFYTLDCDNGIGVLQGFGAG